MSQADSAICHSEAEASRPNLKMDTINLKLQLVEGIKKQLVLGEELIAHHLQTRKTKPALISPSIVFKDAIASEKDYISKQSNPFFEGHIKRMAHLFSTARGSSLPLSLWLINACLIRSWRRKIS